MIAIIAAKLPCDCTSIAQLKVRFAQVMHFRCNRHRWLGPEPVIRKLVIRQVGSQVIRELVIK